MGNAALQDTVNQQQQEIQQVRDCDSCTAGCLLRCLLTRCHGLYCLCSPEPFRDRGPTNGGEETEASVSCVGASAEGRWLGHGGFATHAAEGGPSKTRRNAAGEGGSPGAGSPVVSAHFSRVCRRFDALQLITNKEMQPDLYQKEEYNYGGDGKTEGVGTDAPPQAPAPPPKSSQPEWNKSTRKGSVGPPGPRTRSKSGARSGSAGGSDAYVTCGGPIASSLSDTLAAVAHRSGRFSEEDLHREQAEIMLAAKLAPEAPKPVRDPKARRSRALEVLQRLPGDETLMRWVNFHVGNSVVNGEPFTKRLHNFASDIADGEVLAALVSQIVQYRDHTKMLSVMDPFRRCELVVETVRGCISDLCFVCSFAW